MLIIPLKDKIISLKKELISYQSGDIKPIKTGREWLDSVFGGLIPGDITTIAGSSGGGKTFELGRVKRFIMDINNNPSADKFVWLSNSLEMRLMSNVIRDLSIKLKKSKGKILTNSFTEDEIESVKDYFKDLNDGRYYINELSTDSKTFGSNIRAFLNEHKDKDAVFIDIDHIALQEGSSDKGSVDDTVKEIISINKEFKNVFWIVLSQLNRNILARLKEKDNISAPNRGDLYQSDTIFQASDYLYVTHNPQRLGISEYMRVNADVYDYLSNHFSEIKNGKGVFNTHSRIFYHILKMREADALFKDIFIEEINFEGKSKFDGLQQTKTQETETSVDTFMPNFSKQTLAINNFWEKDDNPESDCPF